jgi:hypothetical protein
MASLTRGMSHAKKISAGARNRFNPVKTPPNGPHRRTASRRITRTGNPVAAAASRTTPSIVFRPNCRRALSLPIRRLKPPARMQMSAGCFSATNLISFNAIDSRVSS